MANTYQRCYVCDTRCKLKNISRIIREGDIVQRVIAVDQRAHFDKAPLTRASVLTAINL